MSIALQRQTGGVWVAARVAQGHGKPQAEQLQHEDGVIQVHAELAHLATLPLHKHAKPMQLGHGKASGIGRELGQWGFDSYREVKQITRYDSVQAWGWYIN